MGRNPPNGGKTSVHSAIPGWSGQTGLASFILRINPYARLDEARRQVPSIFVDLNCFIKFGLRVAWMWLAQSMLMIRCWMEKGTNTVLRAFRWRGILVADTTF